MKQLVAFDQSKAGVKPGMCLQNVRYGYNIGAKYSSAWKAWAKTQQHKNRDIPVKLDVPLFYDYTDSKGNRYGHINVRLANGKIWNDGKIFASLASFEKAWSNVKYVGWGEWINDVKVIDITQEKKMVDELQLAILYRFLMGSGISDYGYKHRLGKQTFQEAHDGIRGSDEFKKRVAQLKGVTTSLDGYLPKEIRSLAK